MYFCAGNKMTRCRLYVVRAVILCAMMTVLTLLYTGQVKLTFQQTIHYLLPEPLPVIQSSIQRYRNTDFVETVDKHGSSDGQCSRHFDKKPVDVLAKIEGLKFPGVEQNMTNENPYKGNSKYENKWIGLFPPMTAERVPPELPVFVTAFSSNHYAEGSFMLTHVNNVVRVNYKDLTIIVYDLGLTEKQIEKLRASCSCELRKFPFHLYPKHVRTLKNYSWKPIIIQTVAQEHPLLFWLDASVRFKTGNLDGLITNAKKQGLMVYGAVPYHVGRLSLAHDTLKQTFVFLNEPPCAYDNVTGAHATFIVIFANQLITKYVLYPWVACALSFGCMEPFKNSQRYLHCPGKPPQHIYHRCHRYDQSVLGILHRLLFHREWKKHAIDVEYATICRFPGINGNCFSYH